MNNVLSKVVFDVKESTFIKDPQTSELGNKILVRGIDLINEIGFDAFTFRKLAQVINSAEASIYRYFESKHKLLLYLTTWYWSFTEYRLEFTLANIESPEERLKRAIVLLTSEIDESFTGLHIDVVKLSNIVIIESSKAYLTKDVDQENEEGIFIGYKNLVERVGSIVLEINPSFKYPNMLISTVIEGAHNQRFFADHLPRLTNVVKGEDAICEFYLMMVFKTISK